MGEDLLSLVPDRTVVDGVPVYAWPTGGPSTIAIMFRVGRVDEVFARMGVSHLVEHLALHGLHRAPYPFNGQVSAPTTTFIATGSADQLADFAAHVCVSLRKLPLDRLRQEIGVLTAERQSRVPELSAHLLSLHCGFDAYGTLNFPEYGFGRLSETDVASWASERFTAANAVVWVAGELPPHLRLELPTGRRMPFPEPRALPGVRTPSCVTADLGVVVLSALRPWEPPLGAAMFVAGLRLSEALRFEKGISYRTYANGHRLTQRTIHATLMADCVKGGEDAAAESVMHVASEMSRTGHTPAELERAVQLARSAYSAQSGVRDVLHEWALCELAGIEQRPLASMYAEMERASSEETAAAMERVLESSLLVVPKACTTEIPRFPRRPSERAAVVEGRKFRQRGAALFQLGPQANYVVVGRAGISHVDAHGDVSTIQFDACAGLLKSSDERRVLLGIDRQIIDLKGPDWRDGAELLALIDAAVPDERTVWTSIAD